MHSAGFCDHSHVEAVSALCVPVPRLESYTDEVESLRGSYTFLPLIIAETFGTPFGNFTRSSSHTILTRRYAIPLRMCVLVQSGDTDVKTLSDAV